MASFFVEYDLGLPGFTGSFKNHIKEAIKSFQNGSSFKQPEVLPFSTTYFPLPTLSIDIGSLYPDGVDESVFQLSPKKATKKLLAGDNYLDLGNLQEVKYSLIDTGKGDDIIFAKFVSSSGDLEVIDAGPGDDLISISNAAIHGDLNAQVFGGKGSDEFKIVQTNSKYSIYPVRIMDFEPGIDVINANFGSRKNKPKTRVIDGDLWLFNRVSKAPLAILNDLTSLDSDDIFYEDKPLNWIW